MNFQRPQCVSRLRTIFLRPFLMHLHIVARLFCIRYAITPICKRSHRKKFCWKKMKCDNVCFVVSLWPSYLPGPARSTSITVVRQSHTRGVSSLLASTGQCIVCSIWLIKMHDWLILNIRIAANNESFTCRTMNAKLYFVFLPLLSKKRGKRTEKSEWKKPSPKIFSINARSTSRSCCFSTTKKKNRTALNWWRNE